MLLQRKCGDEDRARDLRQETFCIALEKLRAEPLAEPEKLAGWLYGVARMLWRGEQTRSQRRRTDADSVRVELAEDRRPGPLASLEREEVARLVRELVGEMSVERDRRLLFRYFVDEEDKNVVCRELGLDRVHFNRVVFRAKQRFRELVEGAERRAGLRLVR